MNTITLDAGERVVYELDDGETFENTLIDQRADGAFYQINARGATDWTIRNVGFLGIGSAGPYDSRFHIEAEGDGLIENVYMEGWGTPLGGIYAPPSHDGHVVQRHTYIAGFGNNAVYASSPAKDDGNEGTWEFEKCLHRDNTVSQFRVGASGSVIRDCVAIVDDPIGRRHSYPWSDSKGARGIWARHCDVRVENTSVIVSPDDIEPVACYSVVHLGGRSTCDEAHLHLTNCHLNDNAPPPYIELGDGPTGYSGELSYSPSTDVSVPRSAKMAANGQRMDTITLEPDENRLIEIGDGETFENTLIDQSADGASCHIRASGNPDDWAIRNVGFKGTAHPSDVAGGKFQLSVSGNGVIENVFIDNRGAETSIGGGIVVQHHSGHIDVRNTFIAGCGNNAFYGSNSGKSGGGNGSVSFHNCYHRDNTVSQFRIGGPGSVVENCVGLVNDPNGERGPYPGSDSKRARGVWARHHENMTVRNSTLFVSPNDVDPWANVMIDCIDKSNGARAHVTLDDVHANPDAPQHIDAPNRACPSSLDGTFDTTSWTVNVLQDGVPMTPEMAARGEREMPPELPGGESMETYTLSEGEYWRPDIQDADNGSLGDGDTFENVLIDCTADNAAFKLNADGDDWTIRNVGVIGQPYRTDDRSDDHLFNVAGNGLVENLFIDARQRNGQESHMGAVRAKASHSGTIKMRHTCILGLGNNASYASSAGKNGGGGGSFVYENCYHRDNTPSNFRPGTPGSVIRNCVSIADDPNCLRGNYKGNEGAYGIRLAWVNHCPDQLIENTTFYTSSRDCQGESFKQAAVIARNIDKSDCDQTVVDVVNCRFGGDNMDEVKAFTTEDDRSIINGADLSQHSENPTVQVLDGGVPLNPQMAANGERDYPEEVGSEFPLGGYSNGTAGDTMTTIEISSDDRVDYEFTVDGTLEASSGIGSGDVIDGSTATGFVNGGTDAYQYDGCVQSGTFEGAIETLTVYRDGTEVPLNEFVECPPDKSSDGSDSDGGSTQPTDLEERVAQLETALNDLESRHDSLVSGHESLSSRVNKLSNRVSSLESRAQQVIDTIKSFGNNL